MSLKYSGFKKGEKKNLVEDLRNCLYMSNVQLPCEWILNHFSFQPFGFYLRYRNILLHNTHISIPSMNLMK